ncbi:MAG: hypothetical protein NXH95_21565 [Pseudomonadaceae bacterium]|nr:hypothetical protein [Pseudomonadaceae bacterium]
MTLVLEAPRWGAVAGTAVACAARAIIVMLIDTMMIPDAFEELHALSGPIADVGFLVALTASHLG